MPPSHSLSSLLWAHTSNTRCHCQLFLGPAVIEPGALTFAQLSQLLGHTPLHLKKGTQSNPFGRLSFLPLAYLCGSCPGKPIICPSGNIALLGSTPPFFFLRPTCRVIQGTLNWNHFQHIAHMFQPFATQPSPWPLIPVYSGFIAPSSQNTSESCPPSLMPLTNRKGDNCGGGWKPPNLCPVPAGAHSQRAHSSPRRWPW